MTDEKTGSIFSAIEGVTGDVTELSSDKLSEIASAEAGIMALFEKVKTEIRARLDQGIPVTGYVLGKGRMNKKWNASEEEIAKMLKARRLKKDQIFPSSLITPAALLKSDLLTDDQKKKIERDFIELEEGKASLKQVAHDAAKDANDMFMGVPEQAAPAAQPISFL